MSKSAKADRRQHPYGTPTGCAMESPRARRGWPCAERMPRPISAVKGRPPLSLWARGGHLHHGQSAEFARANDAGKEKPARPFRARSGLKDLGRTLCINIPNGMQALMRLPPT